MSRPRRVRSRRWPARASEVKVSGATLLAQRIPFSLAPNLIQRPYNTCLPSLISDKLIFTLCNGIGAVNLFSCSVGLCSKRHEDGRTADTVQCKAAGDSLN